MNQVFTAVIRQSEGINGAYIVPPFDVQEVFGSKRVKVKATFDGVEYRGSLVTMGGCYMLGMTQEIRRKIGKDFGDTVEVTVEKDEEERTVEIPDDLKEALNHSEKALKAFERLSFTRKKEYINWITAAKKAETRNNRIEKTVYKMEIRKIK
ncbi:MAG TPA: YdeI/OmpD-associated family protein [Mobilitalea sp.]|nr:YdeI/OmpD-associated family protein [Mobilitalea sp.]